MSVWCVWAVRHNNRLVMVRKKIMFWLIWFCHNNMAEKRPISGQTVVSGLAGVSAVKPPWPPDMTVSSLHYMSFTGMPVSIWAGLVFSCSTSSELKVKVSLSLNYSTKSPQQVKHTSLLLVCILRTQRSFCETLAAHPTSGTIQRAYNTVSRFTCGSLGPSQSSSQNFCSF